MRKSSLMEGFWNYLIVNRKLAVGRARRYIKTMRQFHNYIGKPYSDIGQADIQEYLDYLAITEHRKTEYLTRNLAVIKLFYRYLLIDRDMGEHSHGSDFFV